MKKNKDITGLEELKVSIEGRSGFVKRVDYIKAKTKQLREFGYPTLTEDEVNSQVTAILKGKKLNVIGMFMQGEVLK